MKCFRKMLVATIKDCVTKVESNDLFLFYLCGRGISKVEIVGWVTSVQIKQKKIIYYVDDGSGKIRCSRFFTSVDAPLHSSVAVGDLVCAKGILALSETNDDIYGFSIHLSSIESLTDPNLETYHWLVSIQLYKSEYSRNC